ncbi:GtrA family protein [Bacteroides sp. 519]|uniref:GtrA family protein n=1 Tax=Bacteroides sp. 519 TaxID=2302937 RepID=UPI0013D41336|nr:GtrA family protein [Bacteroides sp. 519]NDV60274.1 GtrA family protein [Bacteroides sp. 519]
MCNWIRNLATSISKKGGIFMFIRAQFSSQLASISDFVITILLAKLFNFYYVYATLLGSVCGGIINCIINYKWTFKTTDLKIQHVMVKYFIVWIGSIALNTWGTYLMTEALMRIPWLVDFLKHYVDDLFIVSKIVVSLLVGYFWNYNLHRHFVYRNRKIKQFFSKNKADNY